MDPSRNCPMSGSPWLLAMASREPSGDHSREVADRPDNTSTWPSPTVATHTPLPAVDRSEWTVALSPAPKATRRPSADHTAHGGGNVPPTSIRSDSDALPAASTSE